MAEIGAISSGSSGISSSSQVASARTASAPAQETKAESSPKAADDSVKISKEDDDDSSSNPVNLDALKENTSDNKADETANTGKTKEQELQEEQKALEKQKEQKEAELEETMKQADSLMSELEDAAKSGNNAKIRDIQSQVGSLTDKIQNLQGELKDIGDRIDSIKGQLQPPPQQGQNFVPSQGGGQAPSSQQAQPSQGVAPQQSGSTPQNSGSSPSQQSSPQQSGAVQPQQQPSSGQQSQESGNAASAGALDGVKPKNPNVEIPDFGRNPSKAQIGQQLEAAAEKYGIPPNILKAVAWQESTWNPQAKSFDGQHGKGVMQIDDRWHEFAKTDAVFDPKQNIEYGTKYLASLYEKTGSWEAALKKYNGGSSYPPKIMAHAESQPWKQYV